jgi:hypothetical protein
MMKQLLGLGFNLLPLRHCDVQPAHAQAEACGYRRLRQRQVLDEHRTQKTSQILCTA